MASAVPSEGIDAEAARWAARALDGDMSADTKYAIETWLAADRRHRGAFLRARAALFAIEDALRGDAASQAAASVGNNNSEDAGKGWLSFGRIALAASLIGTIGIGTLALAPGRVAQQPSESPAAASSDLRLADGSVATLGKGARIDFAMADGVRKVTLLQGEAVFHVAKDRAHPFVVRSGDVYAQATGTVYTVRRIGPSGSAVRVEEGSVLVWGRDDREQAVLLHAGGALTLEPGARRLPEVAPVQIARPAPPPPALAQIALDNVSISAAAARFNRVNRTQIVIPDTATGEIRIVGLFRASDPERFARAAAAVADAEVQIIDGRIVIEKK
ncbi:FecR domain-containing protein [Sphingomonas sp. HF-S4]|uniref:FecR domain-containing protein n=1 Tax=Sphingomonas agrestis TaxID=3080540 RepID=A0ABU3Y3D4_9SPHN|nr:FecR domain-containing protein [Sphingomonas sp. HF-S4]MDV3455898.1 FecR domain-containing protein [Sphingomonas sp. HF-S4]